MVVNFSTKYQVAILVLALSLMTVGIVKGEVWLLASDRDFGMFVEEIGEIHLIAAAMLFILGIVYLHSFFLAITGHFLRGDKGQLWYRVPFGVRSGVVPLVSIERTEIEEKYIKVYRSGRPIKIAIWMVDPKSIIGLRQWLEENILLREQKP